MVPDSFSSGSAPGLQWCPRSSPASRLSPWNRARPRRRTATRTWPARCCCAVPTTRRSAGGGTGRGSACGFIGAGSHDWPAAAAGCRSLDRQNFRAGQALPLERTRKRRRCPCGVPRSHRSRCHARADGVPAPHQKQVSRTHLSRGASSAMALRKRKPTATALLLLLLLLLLSSTRLVMRRSARYRLAGKEARKWGAGGGASLRNETGGSAQCDRAAWRRRSRACRPYEGARGGVPDRGGAYAELSRLRRRCNSPRAVGAPVGKIEMSPKDWRGGLAAIRSSQSCEQRPLGA